MSRRRKESTKDKQPKNRKGKHEAAPANDGLKKTFLKGAIFQFGREILRLAWDCIFGA
ncbi:TPA: hypothetical protein PKO72_002162 [Aeromonas hydrophila]|uniref:hypothetical protein n=1 Tax=Aeromonas hydrophila TaxID=644 RepID=UPI001CCE188D|nr:hypothetical protein [Aeromonas hydrophila]UBQ50527.1 hypothetical protein LCH17_22165 [Aeromonas hydrophila]HDI1213435.1 hypothetical protein [Aeromonas hydrophila]